MDKRKCLDGQKYDVLVGVCLPRAEAATRTDPPLVVLSPVRGTGLRTDPVGAADQADSVRLGLSPALCAIVGLVTFGSVLALAVWLIIYRRQTRLSGPPEDPEPAREPLQKEPPATILPPLSKTNGHAGMCSVAAEAPSPCPHLYLGARVGSSWERGVATCRGPTVQANGCTGLPACGTVSEHKIPLPATELGGTALVTTKTV